MEATLKKITRLTYGYYSFLAAPFLLLLIFALESFRHSTLVRFTVPLLGLAAIAGAIKLIRETARGNKGNELLLLYNLARPVTHETNPRLFNIVEEAGIASGREPPHLYLINDPVPNVFSSADALRTQFIAVSSGLIEKLERSELEAVIAMELASIGRARPLIAGPAAAAFAQGMILGDVVLLFSFVLDPAFRQGWALFFALTGMIATAAGLAGAWLCKLAVVRQDRFLADEDTARMVHDPDAIADALEKSAGAGISAQIQDRVDRLRRIAMGSAGQDQAA